MVTIKRERWRNRFVWVARQSGRLLTWRNVRGSMLNKQTASQLFSENRTFLMNQRVSKESLKNVTEFQRTAKTDIVTRNGQRIAKRPILNISSRDLRVAQYVVIGMLRSGRKIIARSQRIGSPLARNSTEARRRAYDNFYRLLDQEITGGYSVESGIEVFQKQVISIREGWVYYR